MSSSAIARSNSATKAAGVFGATVAVIVGLGMSAPSAQARSDRGEPGTVQACGRFDEPQTFLVERPGIDLVRCDNLVGRDAMELFRAGERASQEQSGRDVLELFRAGERASQ